MPPRRSSTSRSLRASRQSRDTLGRFAAGTQPPPSKRRRSAVRAQESDDVTISIPTGQMAKLAAALLAAGLTIKAGRIIYGRLAAPSESEPDPRAAVGEESTAPTDAPASPMGPSGVSVQRSASLKPQRASSMGPSGVSVQRSASLPSQRSTDKISKDPSAKPSESEPQNDIDLVAMGRIRGLKRTIGTYWELLISMQSSVEGMKLDLDDTDSPLGNVRQFLRQTIEGTLSREAEVCQTDQNKCAAFVSSLEADITHKLINPMKAFASDQSMFDMFNQFDKASVEDRFRAFTEAEGFIDQLQALAAALQTARSSIESIEKNSQQAPEGKSPITRRPTLRKPSDGAPLQRKATLRQTPLPESTTKKIIPAVIDSEA